MGRPAGTRNPDYDVRRAALLDAVDRHLVASMPEKPSLRDLAAAAGVTVPTLKHYFGSRDGVIAAHLEHYGRQGEPFLAELERADAPFADSIHGAVGFILMGLVRGGVGQRHAVGLAEGSRSAALGPAYLNHILEPTLQALERRLLAHMARGDMRQGSARHAAVALASPLLMAALHQQELGGDCVRPLDMRAFASDCADAFIRAYAAG